jgi:hypothetical protein
MLQQQQQQQQQQRQGLIASRLSAAVAVGWIRQLWKRRQQGWWGWMAPHLQVFGQADAMRKRGTVQMHGDITRVCTSNALRSAAAAAAAGLS